MNTTELIGALKLHGSFPTSDDLFSELDILSLFNHQMSVEITPLMLRLNEEYFLAEKDFSIVQGSKYRIPSRAIGSQLRDLVILDSAGNPTRINRLFEEDRPKGLSGYYVTRNSIELTNDFNYGSLRMKFFVRPAKLVLTTSCAQVTGFDVNALTVDVSGVPSTFANLIAIDFVQNNNPYDLLDMDAVVANISGTTLTFSSLPDGLAVGDWICLASQSPVPQVPEELHAVLVQSGLVKALSSKQDKKYQDELAALDRVMETAINMLDPRVKNSSSKMRSGKLLSFFSNGR